MDDIFSDSLFANDTGSSFIQSLYDMSTPNSQPSGNNLFGYSQAEPISTAPHMDMTSKSTTWSMPTTLSSRSHRQDQAGSLCPFSDQPLLGLSQDFSQYRGRPATLATPTTSVGDFSDLSPGITGATPGVGTGIGTAAAASIGGSPTGLLTSASSPESVQGMFGSTGATAAGEHNTNTHRLQNKAKSPSSTAGTRTPCSSNDEYKFSQEYRLKRERNNAAVRKSRIKAKQKSKETEEEVSDLRQENLELKRSLEALRGQLETLRALQPDLFDDEDGQ